MGDLWTRKPSNAMAPHKAADFANGVRSNADRSGSSMKVVTHDGPFHADDVFAFPVLCAAFGDIQLLTIKARVRE
jgi:hypothetical protein